MRIYYLFILLTISCATKPTEHPVLDVQLHWYHKDLEKDKIPGISLEKFYQENKKTPKSSIIVAVLDTQIDATHPELKDQIWTNTKEIPNNGIDDDKNGYIDDVNGWNFLGDKYGGYLVWVNFEHTRIVRNFQKEYLEKGYDTLKSKQEDVYIEYKRAVKDFKLYNDFYLNKLEFYKSLNKLYPIALDSLKKRFPNNDYTNDDLNDLMIKYNNLEYGRTKRLSLNLVDIASLCSYVQYVNNNKYKTSDLLENLVQYDSIYKKNCNKNYMDRILIGDNPKILEKGYGNPIINNNKEGLRKLMDHSTKVSSIIVGNRKNNKEVYGFSDQIKIMPLSISASGDEHDKDIAMAIYYAVDNGAKIINMSFNKGFSLHKQWVYDAIQYAEKNNVLIVKISSNEAVNIDIENIYPIDINYETQEEIAQNMIVVGATTQKADNTLVASYSNYGKKNVDLFAPGDNIYTATYKDKYTTDGGTSLAAPMVSGTAALLWLHYPKLTVQEVKQIILESGTSLDLEVIKPGTTEKVPFSSLSKTGKLLNVYNAMKMAKKY
jgi:cell wall-associated protease